MAEPVTASAADALNPLVRKLDGAASLDAEDRAILAGLCARTRRVAARSDIIAHGEEPSGVHLVMEGMVIRYKLMPEGKRQIVAVLLPGDFCDMHVAILGAMDHSLATVTPCTLVDIPHAAILDLAQNHPRIIRAFWWSTLVDEGTLREWLASLGQRDAITRMAHFFCEMRLRLDAVGLADDDSFHMPLTQVDLADILGMTHVHVNRTLQGLREAQLITLHKRRVQIPNVRGLERFCAFDPGYLHLGDG